MYFNSLNLISLLITYNYHYNRLSPPAICTIDHHRPSLSKFYGHLLTSNLASLEFFSRALHNGINITGTGASDSRKTTVKESSIAHDIKSNV